jgi:UDP-galactopyranose mutase
VNTRILVVGAGFAGATYARQLAEAGFTVDVIDRRSHIAGNAHDEVDETGVRIHRYGPHLFHTNNERVVNWLTRFGEFVPYEHRVQAELSDGQCVPLPVNRTTINHVFGVNLTAEAEVRSFLRGQSKAIAAPKNAAEYLHANIGVTLTDLFFRTYTRKMWDLDLEDLDVSVVKRLPIRFDDEDRYFASDRFQMLPKLGYSQVFANILDHCRISVTLGQAFYPGLLSGYVHCFNSMPIDEYFDYRYGPLPYRSIRFHHHTIPTSQRRGPVATVNFTDSGPLTRETDWSQLPGHIKRPGTLKSVTREEPCDYTENDCERYYPVKTSNGQHQVTYERYKSLATQIPNITFIGRCGMYQYLDMHQVINQSLLNASTWIETYH